MDRANYMRRERKVKICLRDQQPVIIKLHRSEKIEWKREVYSGEILNIDQIHLCFQRRQDCSQRMTESKTFFQPNQKKVPYRENFKIDLIDLHFYILLLLQIIVHR